MKLITTAVAAAGALATAGALSAATAGADAGEVAPTTQPIGTQGTVQNGGVIQGWTVSNLRPSSDTIPYQPRGTLWEATATDVAIQGTVTPVIANLGARSASGQTYPALFGVPTAQGVNPSNLAQGQQTTGKVYFDVTGDAPNSAVYQSAGKDSLVWTPAAPAGGGSSAPATGSPRASAPAGTTGKPGQTAPASAEGQTSDSQATTPGSQGTPLASGTSNSTGTPLPAETGADGTPASADGSEAPVSAGTPEASAPAADAPATPDSSAAAGSSGTPLPADAPDAPAAGGEAPAPAAPQAPEGAKPPVPAGNQGTPVPASAGTPSASGASNSTGSQ